MNRSGIPAVSSPLGARMALAAVILLACVAVAGTARASEYQLGTLDKLSIRVAEWQTAQGSVREWGAINGEYTVGPAGTISVPFIGEMTVKGKTTADVARTIGEDLQQKFGLLDQPAASVEVAQYRPIFISGDAETPGQYPFLPGLTVLKAVSLAGGVRHSNDLGTRFLRDFINARGNYQVQASRRIALLAARARLIAEAAGDEKIDFPKELAETEEGKKLMADETAFKETRETKLNVQLKALEDLKKLLQQEVTSLAQKMETQQRQADLSKKELESVGKLSDQGLAVNERVLSVERRTADLEGKLLDMETASLQAKQDISKADQDAASLRNDFAAEVAQTRQQVESDLSAVNFKIGMYQDLMAEAAQNDPTAMRDPSKENALEITYSIVREADGKTTEMRAEENTAVLPGDVVKVRVSLPTSTLN